MKTRIFTLTLFLTFSVSIAQECSKFYLIKEGVSMELTTYDKKDKPIAVVKTKVTDVRNEDGKQIATYLSEVKDEKGEALSETSYDVSCQDNKLSIDFKSMVNAGMMKQYKDMEYEVSGTNMELPNDLSVGDELPDAKLEMKIDMGVSMKMNVDITERKVISEETVTTPAGTFDCYVIEYTNETKMGMKRTSSGKQWLSEGVGLVKQEDYNKKGDVTSKTVLTALSK